MPTAYELLTTEACDDILTVDLESRTILIPKTVSVLGVESDDETRVLHFRVPRYYCNVDLSEFAIRINYRNAKGEPDMYIVTDSHIEDNTVHFDWVVGRHAFVEKGNVSFIVCLKDVFEGVVRREFNTAIATLPVLEGLETGYALFEGHTDIFEQLREEFGENMGDMTTSVYDPTGKAQDIFKYVEDAVSNSGFPFLGDNITGNTESDTTAFWAGKQNGLAWFSSDGMLIDQPSPYGILLNITYASDVFQIFRSQASGPTYWRSGNASGWAGTWEKALTVNSEGHAYIAGDFTANWLRLTGENHRTDAANKFAVFNSNGWLYYRTVEEVLSDIGAISNRCTRKDSGNVTDLLGTNSNRYIFSSDVTGMPIDNEWWFVDTLSSSSTDITVIAYPILTTSRMYIRTCANDVWGDWHQVPVTNSNGELIVDGNIKGYYVTGEWLRTIADTHRTEPADKIAVLDGSGWVYHRTPAEALSDMGGLTADEINTAIENAIAAPVDRLVLNSSTAGSTKKFAITVDDSGTLIATEITE